MGDVPFGGTRPRDAFDATSGFTGIRAEEHGQPGDGALIIFTFSAHITDPGREVWNGDQFLSQPGEVSDVTQMHHPCRAFTTWGGIRSE